MGKAAVLNEPHGFVKAIRDVETDRVIGVHMVGPHVTDLIAEAASMMRAGVDLDTWTRAIHPHPTLSEALGEALLAAGGRGLHG